MSATLVAGLSVAELCPTVGAAVAPVAAQLNANLTGALAIQARASLPVITLEAQYEGVLEVEAAIEAGIAIGAPAVTFSLEVAAQLVAQARLALSLLAELSALLEEPGGAGLFVYSFSGGSLSTLGGDVLAAGLPPGIGASSPVSGVVIGTSPPAWLSVKPFFGGAP